MPPIRRGVLDAAVLGSRWTVVVTVLGAGVLALLPVDLAGSATLILAGAAFVAGVPHGAVDHLVLARLATTGPVVLLTCAYAGTAALAWGLLHAAGPLALAVIVGLSAVHFGLGELEVHRASTGWRPGPVVATALAVAGIGALVLALARSGAVLSGVAATVSPALTPALTAQPLRVVVVGIWLVAAVTAAGAALRAGHPGIALDVVLIGALGAFAPPLLAFAVWFGGWHAVRHTARLLTVEPGCAALVADGRPRAALLRFARLAALPSAAALIVVALLVLRTATAPDPTLAVAEVLQILLALTVPHMIVVAWLDRRGHARSGVPA